MQVMDRWVQKLKINNLFLNRAFKDIAGFDDQSLKTKKFLKLEPKYLGRY